MIIRRASKFSAVTAPPREAGVRGNGLAVVL